MKKTIINSIKLPKEVEEEFIKDLKRDGTAFLIGIGRFTVTKFRKKMSFVPDNNSKKVRVVLMENNEFSRIGFKPAVSFKKAIG